MLDMILEVDYTLLFESTDRPGRLNDSFHINISILCQPNISPDSWYAGSDPRWGLKNS
jgi:hypothetical protein